MADDSNFLRYQISTWMWIWIQGACSSIAPVPANARATQPRCCPPKAPMRPFLSDPSVHPIYAARSDADIIEFCLRGHRGCEAESHIIIHTHGKGVGFEYHPTRLRRSEVSMLPYMSSPSSSTRPDILQPSTKSFMRFNDLSVLCRNQRSD